VIADVGAGGHDEQVTPTPRSPWLTLAAVAALAVLGVLSLISVLPPAPVPRDAPADRFSARRAFDEVQAIGRQAHVAGSPAASSVRRHIVGRLTELGLQPRLRDGVGATGALGDTFALANATNVVARLPGTGIGTDTGTGTGTGKGSRGTLFVVAHYDSVQVSVGANDDGAGVATLLETLRALKASKPLANDVVAVFTDAEEACLCGAEAFVHDDAAGRGGGVVLNFEARGASGPAIMFETARGNGDLIGHFAKAPYPVGSSMAVEVYRILPNDTDFTPFRESGRFTGLNTAYIDGSAVYHSPEDRPEYLSVRSLQHHGSNALALVRDLGNADLAALQQPSGHDATYFPVLGSLWRYPGWLVWPIAILALVAAAWLAIDVGYRRLATQRQLWAALGQSVLIVAVTGLAAYLFWVTLVAIRPGYAEMIDPWRPWWFRAGLIALVGALLLGWLALLRPKLGAIALSIGGLVCLALLGIVLAVLTPGGSYLASLPALAGALAGIAALGLRDLEVEGEGPELFLHTVGAGIAVVVLAPIVLLFLPALGLATGPPAAIFAVLLGLCLLPVLDRAVPRGRAAGIPALVALMVALACTGAGLLVDRFDAAHPLPTQLMYALDADSGQAWWVSEESHPGTWTSHYVNGHEDLSTRFPLLPEGVSTGPATAASLRPPQLRVVSDDATGAQRMVTFRVVPQRAVRLVSIVVDQAVVSRAVVEGREVTPQNGRFDVVFHAPAAGGVEVALTVGTVEPLTLRIADGSDGLAALPGFVPRPVGVGIQGTHTSELVLVATTVRL
jgi:hypothetical protein